MDTTLVQKILNFAYFYLKFRARTKAEVVRYLEKKREKYRFSPDIIEAVIKQLESEGQINDRRFVEMYVHDRMLLKPRSEYLLRRELQKLGISRDLIDEYFSTNEIDESTLALDALSRKKRLYEQYDENERFKKAVSFLMRKGFSFDTAKNTYRTLFPENSET